jgi:virulence-associated protein VagC
MDIRLDIRMGMPTQTTVFQTGNSLAVRLLGDCRLPRGTKVRERREGNRIVIEAVDEWPTEFLALAGSWKEKIARPKWGKVRDPFA